MIIAEHQENFCDVKLYGDKQILMKQLINIIKALAIRLNKNETTILEILEYYFFLEEKNRKKIVIDKLLKQFLTESAWSKAVEFQLVWTRHKQKDTGLSIQNEFYLYNKKKCVLYKNKNNLKCLVENAQHKKKKNETQRKRTL